MFDDLRQYIDKLEQEGELQRIKEEVDCNLEVGAIIRRCYDLKSPAPLFDNIRGYPKGFRILGAPVGASSQKGKFYARIALSLGLAPDNTAAAIIERVAELFTLKPIKPTLVPTGPCKENIQIGDEVNLFKFPAPYIHQGDGGRYIGTWHIVVTKDLDSGWSNWGLYRLMVHDEKTIGANIAPYQHSGKHYSKYEARNQPMPFALAIGTEPLVTLIAAATVPPGADEAGVIGALRGKSLPVVKCQTVDLEVPATAEIVVEGEVLPHERKKEGPFGEFSGYLLPTANDRPVLRVKAVTHRNNPILPVVAAGAPVDDHLWASITKAAEVLYSLRQQGYPVKMVFIPPMAALHLIVVSVENKTANSAETIADAIWAMESGLHIPKVMVVEDDIDATNTDQLLWVFCTRNHPNRGIIKVTNTPVFHYWPFLGPEERKIGTTTRVVFDCTWPQDWPAEYLPKNSTFDSLWPKDVQQKVLNKWQKYGYPTPD